jgi:UDP-N-acetylglucosamine diphosphorylase / glucose-1-phosphate thymidylyltransferase / UDP-N-acetylgalactosamine diphosphorylase / glucosamine-1-phosphate N-acetyltransferase / galactosamine-1-phosphate N-acetyltransferase
MKNDFSAGSFFDLSGFEHRELFEVENIWEVLSKITGYIKSKTHENILIGEGSTVEEGAFMKGPAIIGKNTLIRHGAYIRENVIVGDNCIIGHSVEIKNSVILNGARIAHFNYIGDSIIGNDVNFAGGTITANFRLDGANVGIKHNGEIIETGLPKLGAIIGDGSKIGVNAVLNPGTILSKNTKVFPLVSVSGVHLQEEYIK